MWDLVFGYDNHMSSIMMLDDDDYKGDKAGWWAQQ
eukprot:SAG11_NODE_31531_length_291_cov_0.802083_1_plen_34_part_10